MFESQNPQYETTRQFLFALNERYRGPLTLRTVNIVAHSLTITSDEAFLRQTEKDWSKLEHMGKKELKQLSEMREIMTGARQVFINCTANALRFPDGTVVHPTGHRPHITHQPPEFDHTYCAVVAPGEIADCPAPRKGCIYIVDRDILLASKLRDDFFTPDYVDEGRKRRRGTAFPIHGLIQYQHLA